MDRESYEGIASYLEDIRTLAGRFEITEIVELVDKIDGKRPFGIASKVK